MVSETALESLIAPNPLLACKETTRRQRAKTVFWRLVGVTAVTKATSGGKIPRVSFRLRQCLSLLPEACEFEAFETYKASDWEASMIVGVASWTIWSTDQVPQCPCSLRSGGRGTLWNGGRSLEISRAVMSLRSRVNTSTKCQLMVRILYRHFTCSSSWKCPG